MVFIDGGYVRSNITKILYDDLIDFELLVDTLVEKLSPNFFFLETIRIYYYDGFDEKSDPMSQIYIKSVRKLKGFEDRLGTLKISKRAKNDNVQTGNKKVQKGVDTLIAIDVLSKAYQGQYDIALLLSGDDDFSPLIDYVKNTGKRIYGSYFEQHASTALEEKLDKSFILTRDWLIAEKIKKDIFVEYMKKMKNGNVSLDVKVRAKLDAPVPMFLSLIALDKDGKVVYQDTTELPIESLFDRSLKNSQHLPQEIQTEHTLEIRQNSYSLLFLLISGQSRQLTSKSFSFNFKTDYSYYEIKNNNLNLRTTKYPTTGST